MSVAEVFDSNDAVGLGEVVASGEVSPVELVDESIRRIEAVDPRLNSVVTRMFDEARRLADKLGADLDEVDQPFVGVPFLLKDLGAPYRGVPLRSSSKLYRDYIPAHHSELVERYLRAGLVPVGRSAASELGILPVTEGDLYGPTHNPWCLGKTPGGSSGGAAAAVAAGLVPLAHGGDGGGSIRIPASCCGLFGLKPSRQRLPLGPDLSEGAYGLSVDHVLTRSVRDSAVALDVASGPEPGALFASKNESEVSFYAATIKPPKRLKIAFTFQPLLAAEPHVDATRAVEDAAALCAELGHVVEPARPSFDPTAFSRAFFLHFAVRTATEIKRAEAWLRRPVSVDDMDQTTWLLSLVGRSISAADFGLERLELQRQSRRIALFFEDYDVLLTPTLGRPPLDHGELRPSGIEDTLHKAIARVGRPEVMKVRGVLDRAVARTYQFTPYTPLFNATGQPSASVPLYWNEAGLPIGTMWTARLGDERTLLSLAAQLEKARPWRERRPPVHAATS